MFRKGSITTEMDERTRDDRPSSMEDSTMNDTSQYLHFERSNHWTQMFLLTRFTKGSISWNLFFYLKSFEFSLLLPKWSTLKGCLLFSCRSLHSVHAVHRNIDAADYGNLQITLSRIVNVTRNGLNDKQIIRWERTIEFPSYFLNSPISRFIRLF